MAKMVSWGTNLRSVAHRWPVPNDPSSFGLARPAITASRLEWASSREFHLCEKCSALSCLESSDEIYLVNWVMDV